MKKGVGPMTAQSLEKNIRKFEREEAGSFHVQSGRGRKRVNSTVVEEVATEHCRMSRVVVCKRAGLGELLEHWIGLLAPRSPDFNPCHFWLWGYLKDVVSNALISRDTGDISNSCGTCCFSI
ncbi:hypothetical protein TNCV_1036471 [Trichonephila clavipes]|nr:hypothetical protein TNCV_1036471 [Trichonephila clavipes]